MKKKKHMMVFMLYIATKLYHFDDQKYGITLDAELQFWQI